MFNFGAVQGYNPEYVKWSCLSKNLDQSIVNVRDTRLKMSISAAHSAEPDQTEFV